MLFFSTELAGHTLLDGGKQCVSIVAAHALNRLEQRVISAEPMSDISDLMNKKRNKAIRCGLPYFYPLMNERSEDAIIG